MGELTPRERKWLETASYVNAGGLYAGMQWDAAPKVFRKLERLGLVRLFEPHNPVHKPRAVITEKGRAALNTQEQVDG